MKKRAIAILFSLLLISGCKIFDITANNAEMEKRILQTGLVAYWDGSGNGTASDDISGHGYTAALGSTAYRTTEESLNGVYIASTPASAQLDGTWTKSDNGVWDAIGDGRHAFALSFWYKTTSSSIEDNILNFVGADYSDVTHSPFIIQSGNFSGGTWFWRGYIKERNNIDMGRFANGEWHNVIITENETGAYGYVDGAPIGKSPLNTGNFSYSTGWNLTFGCRQATPKNDTQCGIVEYPPNNGYMGNLSIDEIAFYNRSFTKNDAAIIYYNGINGTFCKGNPCAWRT